MIFTLTQNIVQSPQFSITRLNKINLSLTFSRRMKRQRLL